MELNQLRMGTLHTTTAAPLIRRSDGTARRVGRKAGRVNPRANTMAASVR